MRCSCESFTSHGYCGHTGIYKKLVAQILYGSDFKTQLIHDFHNCYDFIIELCDIFPECIGEYDTLDRISESVLLSIGRHYKTETIHRAYRLAVANGSIVEPDNTKIRKQETEKIMHDINKWHGNPSASDYNQKTLLREGDTT